MPKFKHIYLELFTVNVYWLGCPRAAYEKAVFKEFDGIAPAKTANVRGTFEVYEKKGLDVGVIWYDSEKTTASAIVHECFHATHWLCKKKGIWLTDSSDEIYAYLLEWFVKQLRIKRRGRNNGSQR